MPEYLAPGVYVEEVSFRAKSIEGVSTTTTGFVGPTRYGPLDLEPDVITSLVEYERTYGDRQLLGMRRPRTSTSSRLPPTTSCGMPCGRSSSRAASGCTCSGSFEGWWTTTIPSSQAFAQTAGPTTGARPPCCRRADSGDVAEGDGALPRRSGRPARADDPAARPERAHWGDRRTAGDRAGGSRRRLHPARDEPAREPSGAGSSTSPSGTPTPRPGFRSGASGIPRSRPWNWRATSSRRRSGATRCGS